ncbi:MAG: glycosyltransferase [Myxococcales bacterium]|nr:glycosyltransferase [Myxococcales bacterium]
MPQTVCLNMIVKNEARVLKRCLDSVRPFVQSWVIVDTGSTDGTQELVRRLLADLPGELHERPWRDFGHNRSEALELARGRADYTLIIDADEILIPDPGFRMPELTADEYLTLHAAGESPTRFFLPQLVRSALPWMYRGVLHEAIYCEVPHTSEKLHGLLCKGFFDGARNADPQAKYRSDARVLEEALKTEPDNARYVFYLAQSHRDAGDLEAAIEAYARRASMGGWAEEVFYSLLQLGLLLEKQGDPFEPAQAAYLRAYQFRPTRAEPLCELARHHREAKDYALAHLFASQARRIPRPDDVLFLDESVYAWRALDEYAIAAYYVGEHRESLAACERLLAEGKLPERQRERVEKNRQFALDALAGAPPDRRDKNRAKQQRRQRR